MARDKGLPEDIYDSIVSRLIDKIPEHFNPSTCYQSLNENAVAPSPGDITAVVAPMSGQAKESYFEGGGEEQLTVDGGVIVKIHSPLQLDRMNQDVGLLSDSTRGLWRIARKVLKYLADSSWSPMKGANEITRDPLFFLGYAITKSRKRKGRKTLGAIELHFRVTFDWDITTADEDLYA